MMPFLFGTILITQLRIKTMETARFLKKSKVKPSITLPSENFNRRELCRCQSFPMSFDSVNRIYVRIKLERIIGSLDRDL